MPGSYQFPEVRGAPRLFIGARGPQTPDLLEYLLRHPAGRGSLGPDLSLSPEAGGTGGMTRLPMCPTRRLRRPLSRSLRRSRVRRRSAPKVRVSGRGGSSSASRYDGGRPLAPLPGVRDGALGGVLPPGQGSYWRGDAPGLPDVRLPATLRVVPDQSHFYCRYRV